MADLKDPYAPKLEHKPEWPSRATCQYHRGMAPNFRLISFAASGALQVTTEGYAVFWLRKDEIEALYHDIYVALREFDADKEPQDD